MLALRHCRCERPVQWETGLGTLAVQRLGLQGPDWISPPPPMAPVMSHHLSFLPRLCEELPAAVSFTLFVVQFQADDVGGGEEAQHGDLWGVREVPPRPQFPRWISRGQGQRCNPP